jgi:hypothetical protein
VWATVATCIAGSWPSKTMLFCRQQSGRILFSPHKPPAEGPWLARFAATHRQRRRLREFRQPTALLSRPAHGDYLGVQRPAATVACATQPGTRRNRSTRLRSAPGSRGTHPRTSRVTSIVPSGWILPRSTTRAASPRKNGSPHSSVPSRSRNRIVA